MLNPAGDAWLLEVGAGGASRAGRGADGDGGTGVGVASVMSANAGIASQVARPEFGMNSSVTTAVNC